MLTNEGSLVLSFPISLIYTAGQFIQPINQYVIEDQLHKFTSPVYSVVSYKNKVWTYIGTKR